MIPTSQASQLWGLEMKALCGKKGHRGEGREGSPCDQELQSQERGVTAWEGGGQGQVRPGHPPRHPVWPLPGTRRLRPWDPAVMYAGPTETPHSAATGPRTGREGTAVRPLHLADKGATGSLGGADWALSFSEALASPLRTSPCHLFMNLVSPATPQLPLRPLHPERFKPRQHLREG